MAENLPNFEDPELKAALRRAMGSVQTPASLQIRIREMMQLERELSEPVKPVLDEPAIPESFSLMRWLHTGRRLAIAASLLGLLLGGGLFYAMNQYDNAESPDSPLAGLTTPPAYIQSAVDYHDRMAQSVLPGQPANPAYNDLRQQTSANLPNLDLSPLGWAFFGAQKHTSPQGNSTQLLYRQDGREVSVFVIADSQQKAARGKTLSVNGRLVAVRYLDGLTLCVVGHAANGRLDARELNHIADFVSSPAR